MTMISVNELHKRYDGKYVVNGISLQLQPGKCVALLGPNGAGKTTTLRMLSGLIRPTSGSIQFDGLSDTKDIRHHIGYLPQYPAFHNWMTGREFLVYVGQLAKLSKSEASKRANELLSLVGIFDAGDQRVKKYSGGMRQRLGIAQALIHNPKLLLLDEPVSALDPIGRREVLTLMDSLKEHTTLLFSTHILNDAEEICDELFVMHQGKMLESGSINDLRNKHRLDKIIIKFEGELDQHKTIIEQLNPVKRVEIVKEHLEIYVDDLPRGRTEILNLIQEKSWPLTKFEFAQTTLEDMFMRMVNK
ncbi:ABC transporter ATP-binding protein [Pseudalkalibacillus berkeleyi]|uniref:ABC transporter ATP-binding protein n=1 Tax=Pseudalkalibacillus berkeleyi TaxID=1069813 RepID=A0ABS9H0M7_9BACL|nr:ABC transporter ATP-binding protein [Pseudalkalibacillus berkeleyi]MCF6137318.1 ABC transporter ATP-binding protein [Pseudalkalibacillus berkeleyi]